MDSKSQLALLKERLEKLEQQQTVFQNEIRFLKRDIQELTLAINQEEIVEDEIVPSVRAPLPKLEPVEIEQEKRQEEIPVPPKVEEEQAAPSQTTPEKEKRDWSVFGNIESFIGTNLISKIGILILIIGVGIGAKYAIDNQLVSPLTRIILGYITGVVLLVTSLKLRTKYENYSAVLLSGGLAILYFITYFGYAFYGLFPQLLAFGLMVVFTLFSVVAAVSYNRQVIAVIGLVGAYAVPFLLSSGSGDYLTLFTYMAIINVGILLISVQKYWKYLFYSAFFMTWIIYGSWMADYGLMNHFSIAITFAFIFFLIFYVTFLAYKLIKKEEFKRRDIFLVLSNSFIFYGLGCIILTDYNYEDYLGLFTLLNAIIHFGVTTLVYSQKLADRNLFYLASGLVLTFLTMAIPVQLDGNWVTLLWGAEAVLLFWIGRTQQVAIYEKMAYPIIFLAFFSLFHDWELIPRHNFETYPYTILFNATFITGLLVSLGFGFITYLYHNDQYEKPATKVWISSIMNYSIPIMFLFALYMTFHFEISMYWEKLFQTSKLEIHLDNRMTTKMDYDLRIFKQLWIFNYTALFLTILSFVNLKQIRNKYLGIANMALNLMIIFSILTTGLFKCVELREIHLLQTNAEYFNKGIMYHVIRYITYGFLGALVYATYSYLKDGLLELRLAQYVGIFVHAVILIVISYELVHWMEILGSNQSDKLALSILWGLYALLLVILGIWKKQKLLRIAGIGLFAITLVKLFFYDIAHLNTISKTIVLVSLGVLLLIISFLYNKYTDVITEETEPTP